MNSEKLRLYPELCIISTAFVQDFVAFLCVVYVAI